MELTERNKVQLKDFEVRTVSTPTLLFPLITTVTNSTAHQMPCCKTQTLWVALIFFFIFISFLCSKERHFRKIPNLFLLEFHCRDRHLTAGQATVSFALLKPDWTDGSQKGKHCETSTQFKKVNGGSLEGVQQNSSILIFNSITVTWNSWKKFVKCLNSWLSSHC